MFTVTAGLAVYTAAQWMCGDYMFTESEYISSAQSSVKLHLMSPNHG